MAQPIGRQRRLDAPAPAPPPASASSSEVSGELSSWEAIERISLTRLERLFGLGTGALFLCEQAIPLLLGAPPLGDVGGDADDAGDLSPGPRIGT